ncbi:hypothetical protein MUP77_15190 [Candidatus Bathyarchaeota archaeon]|nr:hypothetical protein [Candidatus Bathyarchaeota archaeon]
MTKTIARAKSFPDNSQKHKKPRTLDLAMSLTKEYVITNIGAAPDGSQYIFVTLKDPKEASGPKIQPMVPDSENMNDMMRNIGRIITLQMTGGFTTVIKLKLGEYEDLDIKVGDKVSLTMNKVQLAPT